MIEVIDQMKRTIRLEETPKRIVSLVPSQTELLHHLGCDDQVVGITKFCVHPDVWYRSKKRVGGTKNVNFEALKNLNPDLIIANKEENSQADIDRLMKLYPVYMSDVFNVEDACGMIRDVGQLVGKSDMASKLVTQVQIDFSNFPRFEGRVLYFIWSDPYMVAGSNTFIGHLIETLGFTNAISDSSVRYVELSEMEIQALNPDHILLSSEPFPFSVKHESQFEALTNAQIHLVDGEMFSWYGSRMLKMKAYFTKLSKAF